MIEGLQSHAVQPQRVAGACVDFDQTSVLFAGLAKSVSFGGDAGNVVYDNITLNILPVPEPESYALMFAGLAGIGLMVNRKRG